uniref:hypothetical protein n=1 Tax=Klebsormidium crenulatum TaxID=424406 RepID=UPI00286AA70A|nr:hypothetical protein RMD54_pgp110 [Klebsormidium crenulatum]WKT06368.1 hypothetical protein [Klebsormidium crenulatum]
MDFLVKFERRAMFMSEHKNNHSSNSSFDGSQSKPPVFNANWTNRFFVACCTLVGICVGVLLKDILWPSVVNAAPLQQTTSISTQSLKKSCISLTDESAPHHLSCGQTANSLLVNRVSEGASFKKVKQVPPIASNGVFVSMQRTQLPKVVSVLKVERLFAIDKQNCSYKSTRNVLVRPPGAFPFSGLGDFQILVQAYDSYNKQEEKKVDKVEIFIKDYKIENPDRIALVKETSAKLMEQNLCPSKRGDVVLNALEMTSFSSHNLASTTAFTEQDKNIYLQDSRIAGFLLKTAFPPKNETLAKTINQNFSKFRGSTVSLSHNDPEIWQNLNYKAKGVLACDLAVELTGLRFHLETHKPSFTPVFKLSSLIGNYFKMQISQLDTIVQEGWEEQIRANRGQKTALTSTVIRVNNLRGESLFSYYDKTGQTCFQDELLSATRKKLSNICDRRCLSDIIEVSQLNLCVLFHHGFCSEAQSHSHFEEWLKSDNGDW